METTHLPSGGEVLGLLSRQVDLYRRLGALADRQRRLVAEEDPQPLLRLLADRRKLTEELTEMSGQLEPYRARWPVLRATLTPQEQTVAEQLLQEAGERLSRIIESDRMDAQLLAARKARTAVSMSSSQAGRRMLTAYGDPGAPGVRGTRMDRMDVA
jgi:hypothetical protein